MDAGLFKSDSMEKILKEDAYNSHDDDDGCAHNHVDGVDRFNADAFRHGPGSSSFRIGQPSF